MTIVAGYQQFHRAEIGDAIAELHTLAEKCAAEGDKVNALNLRLQAVMCAAALRYVREHDADIQELIDADKARAMVSAIGSACTATAISTVSTICSIDRETVGVLRHLGGSMAEAALRAIASIQDGTVVDYRGQRRN